MREKFTGIIVEESCRLSNLVNDLLAVTAGKWQHRN